MKKIKNGYYLFLRVLAKGNVSNIQELAAFCKINKNVSLALRSLKMAEKRGRYWFWKGDDFPIYDDADVLKEYSSLITSNYK